MNSINRKEFLQISGLASASLLVPRFLNAFAANKIAERNILPAGDKSLVIIQMSGGNDGLNTVIPYSNDDYYSYRPNIAIPKSEVLTLTGDLGLNPELKAFKDLYDKGFLTILNNVGYPNPDRSHFRSMDIWQSASGSDSFLQTGWIGRYLDNECSGCSGSAAIEVDDTLSLAMKGELKKGMAVSNINRLHQDAQRKFYRDISSSYQAPNPAILRDSESTLDYIYKTQAETLSSADYLFENYKPGNSYVDYPKAEFGKNLQTIACLINAGITSKVYYVSLGSFDTHVGQKDRQQRLFQTMSDCLSAFTQDLQKSNRFKDTLIMTFSEFGRRVKENASNGTDHGTANNMFLISGALQKPGIYNDHANLADLDNYDLKYKVDFRSVYATVLNKWLKADAARIINGQFEMLDFI
jgi:uncharacterized protein (DUF1501 family)